MRLRSAAQPPTSRTSYISTLDSNIGGARPRQPKAGLWNSGTVNSPSPGVREPVIPSGRQAGPELDICVFGEEYNLSSVLRDKLVGEGYTSTAVFPFASFSDLKADNFKEGEIAMLKAAVQKWPKWCVFYCCHSVSDTCNYVYAIEYTLHA